MYAKLKKVYGDETPFSHVGKVMLIVFFDYQGMVYQHIVPQTSPKTTVYKEYYIEVLKNLREHLQRKRPDIAHSFILHQDNAQPHTAELTQVFFKKYKIEVTPHPPYSLDLMPCEFWLFPTLKRGVRGRSFKTDSFTVALATSSSKVGIRVAK